jgi:hypothetical protein
VKENVGCVAPKAPRTARWRCWRRRSQETNPMNPVVARIHASVAATVMLALAKERPRTVTAIAFPAMVRGPAVRVVAALKGPPPVPIRQDRDWRGTTPSSSVATVRPWDTWTPSRSKRSNAAKPTWTAMGSDAGPVLRQGGTVGTDGHASAGRRLRRSRSGFDPYVGDPDERSASLECEHRNNDGRAVADRSQWHSARPIYASLCADAVRVAPRR